MNLILIYIISDNDFEVFFEVNQQFYGRNNVQLFVCVAHFKVL